MQQILGNSSAGGASARVARAHVAHEPLARIGDTLEDAGGSRPLRSFRLERRSADSPRRASRGLAPSKIVFVNRFFYPDESATSQMLSDLAFALAKQGFDVRVVASRLDYTDPSIRRAARERINGVNVYRVWTSRFGRSSLVGRAVDYLTFYLSAGAALVRTLARGDVLVAKTDPPLISAVGALACRLRRAKLVTWLQDLYPEVARAAGVRLASGPLWHVANAVRNWSLQTACANVAIGEHMREYLARSADHPQPITVIHNWADGESIRPIDAHSNPLRREWGLAGRFVVEYSGNLGRVHDYRTLLEVATALRDDADVVLLFVGQGHGFRQLREQATQRNLTNVVFQPPQPRARLGQLLCVGDAHLVTLAPGMGRFVVPSKLYGVLAAGRPVLFVGGADSEIPRMLETLDCGAAVAAGDVDGLARAIRALAADAQVRTRLASNARRAFDERFSRRAALAAWREVILAAGAPEIVPAVAPTVSA